MKNIFEVKCQINQQSNPGGPVVQYACWKISGLQQVIHRYFDRTYGNQWRVWLSKVCSDFICISNDKRK